MWLQPIPILQAPGPSKKQVHRENLNDVEDVIVVEILAGSETGHLNGKSEHRYQDSGDDPFSILSSNICRMDARAKKGSACADR